MKGKAMIIYLPLIVCVIGAVVYLAAKDPKVARLGEISFFCGLFTWLWLGKYGL